MIRFITTQGWIWYINPTQVIACKRVSMTNDDKYIIYLNGENCNAICIDTTDPTNVANWFILIALQGETMN